LTRKTFEIEVKAYCGDLVAIEKRLEARGARFISYDTEEDVYYNSPIRDFSKTDEALRIRRCNDALILTYKGPKVDAGSKTREEFEAHVDKNDSEAIDTLLARLGFIVGGKVKKRRKLFGLDDMHVCLDEVDGLGHFVEVEIKGEDIGPKRDRILKLMQDLGLQRFERRSYLELLAQK